MKKILIWVLLVSFINLTGCYYSEQLVPSTYKFDERKNLTVITKDTSYNFNGDDYSLGRDTLITVTSRVDAGRENGKLKFLKIPVEEMQTVEVDRIDVLDTVLLSAGIAVVVILVVGIIELGNSNWFGGGKLFGSSK